MAMRRIIFFSFALAATLVLAGCASTSTNTSAATTSSVPAQTPTTAAPTTPTAAPTTSNPGTTSPPAPPPPPPPTTAKSVSPANVVAAYFAAINARDYSTAWALGGENLGQSFAQFADGFSDTAEDELEIVAVSGDNVTIDLTAVNNDGSQQTFAGTYRVSGGRITGASVVQTGPVASPLCGAPNNPYGFNFCGQGGHIYNPPSDICNYFSCIDNFWNGRGYMVECQDSNYSMSGGIDGVCNDNGGTERVVYGG